MTLRILSNLDLESQIDANGATWLDRELASPNRAPLVQAGFGTEVSGAMQRRKEALVDQGLAWRTPEGGVRAPKDLVAGLERGEVEGAGKSLSGDKHTPFRLKREGERVSGVFTGTTNAVSGKYAIIDNAHEFTLVPWRPVMDDRLAITSAESFGIRASHGILRVRGPRDWDMTATRSLPPATTPILVETLQLSSATRFALRRRIGLFALRVFVSILVAWLTFAAPVAKMVPILPKIAMAFARRKRMISRQETPPQAINL